MRNEIHMLKMVLFLAKELVMEILKSISNFITKIQPHTLGERMWKFSLLASLTQSNVSKHLRWTETGKQASFNFLVPVNLLTMDLKWC